MKKLSYECCYTGKFDEVKKLLENGEDPNESDAQNGTPLHFASKKGFKEIAKLLIEHGANLNAKLNTNYKTPLHEATIQGHLEIVKLLIKNGADLSMQTKNQTTPILIAAVKGHVEIVEYLIKKGGQISDFVPDQNMSPFQLAVRNKHFLIDNSAHLNIKNIGAAIRFGRLEIVKCLIQKGGVKISDSNLFVAIEFSHTDIVRFLVENGANVNAKDYVNLTPLLRALKNDYNEIVKILLENGADPDSKDLYQMSALEIAIERNNHEIAKILIEHGACVQRIKTSEFLNICVAVKIGHVKIVKHVFSQNEVRKEDLQRSLMIAIEKENLKIVKLLLKQDAIDPNYSIIWPFFESEMVAPIHLATKKGNEKIVKCLLKHGANVNQIQCIEFKIAPIHQVVKTGNTELAKLLLKNGANLNLQQNNGDTALHLAIQSQKGQGKGGEGEDRARQRGFEMLNTFLTHGIPNLKLKGRSGQTPLELAKSLDYNETIEIIVQKMIEDSEKRKQENLQPKKKKIKLEDCIICCCQRDAIYVMYPCGHAKTCETCCLKILNSSDGTRPVCPVCRERAENYVKVFY